MIAMFSRLLKRLFLGPALWVAMLPGIVVVLLDWNCTGYQPVVWRLVCDLGILNHGSPNWDWVIWATDALLYAGLRAFDAKKYWNATHRVAWLSEIALLVLGEYIVFYSVAFVALLLMRGI